MIKPGIHAHSVVRRSMLLVPFIGTGHALYYLFLLGASHLLDSVGFGRFYAGWSALNILAAPGAILSMALSGYFAEAYGAGGGSAVMAKMRRAIRSLWPWLAAYLGVALVATYLGGSMLNVDGMALVMVLPVTAMSFIALEVFRAALQGMLRFAWFGATWVAQCLLQVGLGAAGIVASEKPWAGFAGMTIANLVMLAATALLVRRLARGSDEGATADIQPDLAPIRTMAPFIAGYAGFMLLNSADVLAVYWLGTAEQLGAYSAAAMLPKALVTATQPILQILLPVMISLHAASAPSRQAVVKAILVTLAAIVAGCTVLWLNVGGICGGGIGIRFCDVHLMSILAMAALPLSLFRIAMVVDLARRIYWVPHLPFLIAAAFAAAVVALRPTTESLAFIYVGATIVGAVAAAIIRGTRSHVAAR